MCWVLAGEPLKPPTRDPLKATTTGITKDLKNPTGEKLPNFPPAALRSYRDSMCALHIFQVLRLRRLKNICNSFVLWVYISLVFTCGAPISCVFQLHSESISRILPRGASGLSVFYLYLILFSESAPAAPKMNPIFY